MPYGESDVMAELLAMRGVQERGMSSVSTKLDALTDKVDDGFRAQAAVQAAHELADVKQFGSIDRRLQPLEQVHRTVRWLVAALIVALLGGAADAVFNHAKTPDVHAQAAGK